MGVVFRQSVKTSIVTFAGALLGAVTLYLGAKYIPKQQLGFLRNTLPEQAALLAQIFSVGLNVTLIVYVHKFIDDVKRCTALISMSFLLPLLFWAAGLPFYYIFRDSVTNLFQPDDKQLVANFYNLLPVLTIFFIYILLLEQYLISQLKVAIATFMREVLLRTLTVFLIMLYAFQIISFSTLVYGSVLVFVLPISILFVLAFRTQGFRLTFKWNVFARGEKKDLLNFTWYHFLLTISINLLAKLDIILLGMWHSLSAAAVYGIAIYILSFLQIPYRAMLSASFPILAKAYHDEDAVKVKDIFVRSSLNILIGSVGMGVVICSNLHNAVAILPNGYEAITPLVLVLIIGKLFDLSTGVNDQLLSLSKYYRFSFLVSCLIVGLLVLLNYWFIPLYGYFGAAISSTVSMIVFNVTKFIFIKKKLSLSPFSKNSARVIAGGVVSGAAGVLMPSLINPVIDTIVRTPVVLIIYVAFLLWSKSSKDLSNYWASVFNNRRLF